MSSSPVPPTYTRKARSAASLSGDASETGSVLVDWERSGTASSKSFPVLRQNYDASSATVVDSNNRNAVSLYDSDSDSDQEYVRRRSSGSKHRTRSLSTKLFRAFTGGSDDDGEEDMDGFFSPSADQDDEDGSIHSEDCMILTDDEDDIGASASTEDTNRLLTTERLMREQQDLTPASHSKRDSIVGKDAAASAALFVEKHPWRKRRSSRSKSQDQLDVHEEVVPEFAAHQQMPTELQVDSSMDSDVSPRGLLGLEHVTDGLVERTVVASDEDDEDSESSTSEESETSIQSSMSAISDPELNLDFDALEYIPSSFIAQQHVLGNMLDPSLKTMQKSDSNRFAYEHALLLRAILQLLAERDLVGVAADINDPSSIVKKGPLKKMSHSIRNTWKVKYVEVRPGSFSYFEDQSHIRREGLGRKTIPLRSNKSIVEVVKKNVFALTVEDGPKRLFMTNSEDELKAWTRAIQEAMLGGSAEDGGHSLDVALYQVDLDHYQAIRTKLGRAKKRREYMSSIEALLDSPLQIPVQWVREQMNEATDTRAIRHAYASIQKRMKTSVAEFWRNLSRETVSINGYSVNSQSPRGAERIVGALTRCILEFDKTSPTGIPGEMSELQAISYARDVINAVLRIRSKDDAQVTLNQLCQNPNLVIVVPFARLQPLRLLVAHANSEFAGHDHAGAMDVSGWVQTRSRLHKNWKNRFCVVSEGVLSWFEHGTPRPHGLRGQFVLAGASVKELIDKLPQEEHLFILLVAGTDGEKERQLAFRDENVFFEWKSTIQNAIDSCSGLADDATPRTWKKSTPPAGRIIRGASEGGSKIIRGATDILRVIRPIGGKTPNDKVQHSDRESTDRSSLLSHSSSVLSDGPTKAEPTVQIIAEGASIYKIITSEPTGNDSKDTWITVRASFTQTFHLCGGHHGRLTKGDELVKMEFRRGAANVEDFVPEDEVVTP